MNIQKENADQIRRLADMIESGEIQNYEITAAFPSYTRELAPPFQRSKPIRLKSGPGEVLIRVTLPEK